MKRFPTCTLPRPRAWDLPRAGRCRFFLATADELHAVDEHWGPLRRKSDTHGWEWRRVLLDARVCVYALRTGNGEAAALFGTPANPLDLSGVPTRRLDFFQVSPAMRGTGVARLAFAAFARLTLDFGNAQLVLGALPARKVVDWYTEIGGSSGEPRSWRAGKGLVKFLFSPATLTSIAEYADAVEEEDLT